MFIDKNGNLYLGDMQIGDREATKKEIQAFQDKQELVNKLIEAQFLLDSTEYKFNEDYDKKYTPEWEELKLRRAESRKFIRDNK